MDPINQSLPIELQARPKIARTPLNADKTRMQRLLDSGLIASTHTDEHSKSFNEMVFEGNPPMKEETKKQSEITRELRGKKINEQHDEYSHAFESR